MSAGLAAGQILVFSTAAVKAFEYRYGNLQVVEPSVWGVQVGYAGDFDCCRHRTDRYRQDHEDAMSSRRWSQPNQQVVRDGDPVGIVSDDPDPQQGEASSTRPTTPSPKSTTTWTQNPDDQKRVVKAEKAGKNRASIVDV